LSTGMDNQLDSAERGGKWEKSGVLGTKRGGRDVGNERIKAGGTKISFGPAVAVVSGTTKQKRGIGDELIVWTRTKRAEENFKPGGRGGHKNGARSRQ